MLRSPEGSQAPAPKPVERPLRPRIEAKPVGQEATQMVEKHSVVGMRVLDKVTQTNLDQLPEDQLPKAIENNTDGIGSLTTVDRLVQQPEGDFANLTKDNEPEPLSLGHKLSVKDATGQAVTIAEVTGRSGDNFRCTTINQTTGQPEREDVLVPRDEVLRAEMIASEADLTAAVDRSSLSEQEKAVFKTFMETIKGDSTQIETALADPTKKQEMQTTLAQAQEKNGVVSERMLRSLVDTFAPEKQMPQSPSPETLNYVNEENAKRQKLLDAVDDTSLSDGEKMVRILESGLPENHQTLEREIAGLEQKLAHAQTKEEQAQIQDELTAARDLSKGLRIFEDTLKAGENGQESQFVQEFNKLQRGTLDTQTSTAIIKALETKDYEALIENMFEKIPTGVQGEREKAESTARRNAFLKKHGKITLGVILALIAAGGFAAKGGLSEE